MKTEPTDALKALQHYDNMDTGCVHVDVELRPIVITAFKEGQSNPKIKQLEWEKNKDILTAKTAFGSYIFYKLWTKFKLIYVDKTATYCNSIDEAKSAAQEDFENRVKQCLEL